MVLIAVQPHVEDVEGAHRRPAVLVGEGEGDELVGLHLLGQRFELVQGRGRLVPLLLPDRLAVEDRPRVVGLGREVLLAVIARGRSLERVVDPVQRPDVADVADQATGGEEPHPVAGEPGEDVVRAALEVVVDVLLERVVLNVVDRDLHAALLREVGRLGVPLLGEGGAALVDAEGHRPGRRAASSGVAAGTAGFVATTAGRQQTRHGCCGTETQGRLDQVPPVESLPGHGRRDDSGQVLGLGLRSHHFLLSAVPSPADWAR